MTTTEIKAGEQMQHTPGPWTADVRNDGDSHLFIEDQGGNVICNITRVTETGDNEWANARLIAAAPELLEALKRIMEYAHAGAAIRDVDPSEQPQFINARAAIAKAEGK